MEDNSKAQAFWWGGKYPLWLIDPLSCHQHWILHFHDKNCFETGTLWVDFAPSMDVNEVFETLVNHKISFPVKLFWSSCSPFWRLKVMDILCFFFCFLQLELRILSQRAIGDSRKAYTYLLFWFCRPDSWEGQHLASFRSFADSGTTCCNERFVPHNILCQKIVQRSTVIWSSKLFKWHRMQKKSSQSSAILLSGLSSLSRVSFQSPGVVGFSISCRIWIKWLYGLLCPKSPYGNWQHF